MENVVSEIEVVDEGEVARPAIEGTCVGPPQATGPQTVKAPAWKIIGNAPSVSQITHQVARLFTSVLSSDALSRRVRPLDFFLVAGASRLYGRGESTVRCVRVRGVYENVMCRVPSPVRVMMSLLFREREPREVHVRVGA